MSSTNTYVHKCYKCAEHRASKLVIIIHCTAPSANSLRSCTVKKKKKGSCAKKKWHERHKVHSRPQSPSIVAVLLSDTAKCKNNTSHASSGKPYLQMTNIQLLSNILFSI